MKKNKAISISVATAGTIIRLAFDALVIWAIAVAFVNYGVCFRTIFALAVWYMFSHVNWRNVINKTKRLEEKLNERDSKKEEPSLS